MPPALLLLDVEASFAFEEIAAAAVLGVVGVVHTVKAAWEGGVIGWLLCKGGFEFNATLWLVSVVGAPGLFLHCPCSKMSPTTLL